MDENFGKTINESAAFRFSESALRSQFSIKVKALANEMTEIA